MGLNVGTLQATLDLDSKPFQQGAEDAVAKGGAELGAFGRLAETAGVNGAGMFSNGISGLKGDLEQIGLDGGTLMAAGVAVGAAVLVGAAYNIGEEFHQAFATIQTDSGATGEKLSELKDQAEAIYADVPNSIMEVAQAVGVLEGRLGGAPAVIGPLADSLLKLGNAFGGDPQQNAQQFADVMTRWSVPVSQGKQVLDELAAAAEGSGIPVQQLMQDVANGAPDFQLLGMNVAQATAWVAAFAKTGGDASALFQGVNHSVAALATINQQNAATEQANAKQKISDAQAEQSRIDAIASAEKGVQKAVEQVGDAQKALNALLSGGIERAVVDGRNQIADATDAVTDAEASWIKSKQDLDDLLKGPSESDEEKARLKVQQATDAVTASLTAEAKAQNDLSDAQASGVSGTALAQLQDALASATSGVTQAQLDQQDAQQSLADLAPDSAKSQAAIADAQQTLLESSHKLSDAQASQADTQANVTAQLGPAMDGSALLAAAQQTLADAHDQVSTAQDGVRQASQKQVSQQQTEAVSTDALGGHYATTQKILAQLGLTHASVADQTAGLNNWLLTTTDSSDRLGVAMEAEGTRAGVKLSSDIGRAQTAHEGLTGAINNSTGAVNTAAAAHESGADRMSKAWHQLEDDFAPIFDAIEGFISDLTGWLDDLVTWWSNDGVDRFKNGLTDLWNGIQQVGRDIWGWVQDVKQWILDGWNDVVGFVTGIPKRISDALSGMWDFVWGAVVTVGGWISGAWDTIVGTVTGLPGRIADAATGLWDGLKAGLQDALNWCIDRVNDLLGGINRVASWIPGVSDTLIPTIPHVKFHSGGVVPGAPGSELPALLQAGETVRTGAQEAALQGALAVVGGGGMGGAPIVVNINGPVGDRATAQWIVDGFNRGVKAAMPVKLPARSA